MNICSPPEVLITEELRAEEGEDAMNYYHGTVSGWILTVWAVVYGEATCDRSDSSGVKGATLLKWK